MLTRWKFPGPSAWDVVTLGALPFLFFVLALMVILGTGCDESDAPAVHGTIRVDASPLPPFEVQFRDGSPSPTPVEW